MAPASAEKSLEDVAIFLLFSYIISQNANLREKQNGRWKFVREVWEQERLTPHLCFYQNDSRNVWGHKGYAATLIDKAHCSGSIPLYPMQRC